MHQIRFRLRLHSRLCYGSLQRAPRPLLDLIFGAASRQWGKGKGWGNGGERDEKGGKEGTREGREMEWMEEGRGKVTEGMGGTGQDMG